MKNSALTHNTFLASFTDIMANLLAIMVLVLLLSLWQNPIIAYEKKAFPNSMLNIKPFDRYYLFLDQKVIEINLDKIARAYFAAPRLSFDSDYGQVRIRNDIQREPRYDPQSFLLLLELNLAKLEQQGQAINKENFSEFFVQEDWQAANVAVTLIVLPSAFAHFASFFEDLEKSSLRFRWFALPNNILPFSYEVHDLSSRERQR